jgi:hypothetical protein
MADRSPGLDVLDIVSRALAASHGAAGALVIPTLLLDRDQLAEGVQRTRGPELVNYVADWFRRYGFHAARSSVGIGQGYGAIIKEILDWYGSTITTLRSQQEAELSKREAVVATLSDSAFARTARELENALFEEKLTLRQTMTETQCEACYNAIFPTYVDEDGTWTADFKEGPGAPDLLVWHSDPSQNLWFFCEVKSQSDRLRPTQHDWLQGFWQQIDGRFLLLLLGA